MGSQTLLLIDIGNTAVKLRRASPDSLIGATRRVPTAEILAERGSEAALAEALGSWRYGRVVLCSVVPSATRRVLAALPEEVPVVEIRAGLRGLGVDLSLYPQRRTLGADRLANMAGALALHGTGGCPLIVVDFGTAATFNVLDETRRRFIGGVIAPGLASMNSYLPARGSQLPALGNLRVPASLVGRSTRTAMLAGTVIGYRGLVREIITSLQVKVPGSRVIATGGDAPFVARLLPELIGIVEPALTMEGLRMIFQTAR